MKQNYEISESRLQSECFQWFWNSFPSQRQMLFHVQNKAMNAIEGNRFKAMGVVKGVSDLILILTGRMIFIELKTDEGRQSPEQIEFQAKVTARGHRYEIIRSLVEFKALVNKPLRTLASLTKDERTLISMGLPAKMRNYEASASGYRDMQFTPQEILKLCAMGVDIFNTFEL